MSDTARIETDYIVSVDHAYNGESERTFSTREAAEAYRAEASNTPYVNRTSIYTMVWSVENNIRTLI
jgi:hypothetical protein